MSPVQSGDGVRRDVVRAIEAARLTVPMTTSEAARRAHVSTSWWSSVVHGRRNRAGQIVEVQPSIEKLIAMARAVGAEADVRRMLGLPPLPPASRSDGAGGASRRDLVTLDRLEWEQKLLEAYRAGLRAGREEGDTPRPEHRSETA